MTVQAVFTEVCLDYHLSSDYDGVHMTPWILPLAYDLGNENVMKDTAAVVDFLKTDSLARDGAIGCVGYCMGGRMAIAAAGTFPQAVKATASLYGGRQVTDKPDSPHRVAQKSDAEFYFAFAGTDRHVPDEQREAIGGGKPPAGSWWCKTAGSSWTCRGSI